MIFLLGLFLLSLLATASALSTKGTILVIARDNPAAKSVVVGLDGYGIPYQTILVPASGVTLPALTSSPTSGNYGGIVIVSEVSYQYGTSFLSALTTAQWDEIFQYQATFGVRLVRLDSYPSPEFGVTTASDAGQGCCNTGEEQTIAITDSSEFPTANIKTNAELATTGLWHYPAKITNSTIATPIAKFGTNPDFPSDSVAAIINDFGNRKQMVWFIGWAAEWSITSTFLQHTWIHWLTRGIYTGFRRVYLGTQIDDVFLVTTIYDKPNQPGFRLRPADMDSHLAWLDSVNARMPSGSFYFSEMGHNGNGDIEVSLFSSLDGHINVISCQISAPLTAPPSLF